MTRPATTQANISGTHEIKNHEPNNKAHMMFQYVLHLKNVLFRLLLASRDKPFGTKMMKEIPLTVSMAFLELTLGEFESKSIR